MGQTPVASYRSAPFKPPSRRLTRVAQACLTALLVLTACSDLVGPGPVPNEGTPPLMLRDAALLDVLMNDASERIVPALPEDAMREDLAAALRQLTANLQIGLAVPVRDALDHTRSATTRYAARFEDATTEADLAALRLAFDVVARHLAELGK